MTMPAAMRTDRYVYGVQPVDGYAAWELFEAAADGDPDRCSSILSQQPETVNAQFWYQMPIHFSVRAGHAAVTRRLLDHGADPGQSRFLYYSWDKLLRDVVLRKDADHEEILTAVLTTQFCYSPKFEVVKKAIIDRDIEQVRRLITASPELARFADALGNTSLHWSVITRQRELVHLFVDAGTPIDARRADGQTATMLAANGANDYWYRGTRSAQHPSLRNSWVMVGDLLSRGAHYTATLAAAVGDQEHLKRVVEAFPQLAVELDESRVSPLSLAAREGYLHIVEWLLEHGAQPSQPEELAPRGRALFEACGGNHVDIVRSLLQHGADPDAGVDSCGTCLTICRHHHGKSAADVEKLLLEAGARKPAFSLKAAEIRSAIEANDVEILQDEELLANVLNGSNTRLLGELLDRRPELLNQLHAYAGVICPRSARMLQLLLDRGLDVNQTDWQGRTMLHAAAERMDVPAARRLLDSGADVNRVELEFCGTPLATALRSCCELSPDALPEVLPRLTQMVRLLLKHGAASETAHDNNLNHPVRLAERLDVASVVKMLQAARSN